MPVAPIPPVGFVVLDVRVVTVSISFEPPISIPDNHCGDVSTSRLIAAK
jgi:hypothetical protein